MNEFCRILRQDGHPLPNWFVHPGFFEQSVSQVFPLKAVKRCRTLSLDMNWLYVRNIWEFDVLLRYSFGGLITYQGNAISKNGRWETRCQGLKLFKLFLHCVFVVESQVIGKHVANFLWKMSNRNIASGVLTYLLVCPRFMGLLQQFLDVLEVHLLVYLLQNFTPRFQSM